MLFIQYYILALDNWLENQRYFPYYILPLIVFSFYHYSLITALAILGVLITNLRALSDSNNFLLERLESLGNLFVYIIPFTLPIGLNNFQLYLAACLFLLGADCFHKIGHRETKQINLTWLSGLCFLTIDVIIFARPNWGFAVSTLGLFGSLIPFWLIKSKFRSWLYTQFWLGLAGIVAFSYNLYNFV